MSACALPHLFCSPSPSALFPSAKCQFVAAGSPFKKHPVPEMTVGLLGWDQIQRFSLPLTLRQQEVKSYIMKVKTKSISSFELLSLWKASYEAIFSCSVSYRQFGTVKYLKYYIRGLLWSWAPTALVQESTSNDLKNEWFLSASTVLWD